MLAVLEQAQGAGQKIQQDAEIGQGSIFDLFDAAPADGTGPTAPPRPSPVRRTRRSPRRSSRRTSCWPHEKEAIGLFLSMHPLKEVREALLATVDRPLSELPQVKDGEWITVGGIITAARKLKTRTGNMMMFATLDDLEGSIELIFFGDQLAEYEHVAAGRRDRQVRGRVGNDDRGLTIKVQACERFKPSEEEVETARAAAVAVAKGPEALTHPARRLAACPPRSSTSSSTSSATTRARPRSCSTSSTSRRPAHAASSAPSSASTPTPSLRAELAEILGPGALAAPPAPAAV